jgi:hypothetical protein
VGDCNGLAIFVLDSWDGVLLDVSLLDCFCLFDLLDSEILLPAGELEFLFRFELPLHFEDVVVDFFEGFLVELSVVGGEGVVDLQIVVFHGGVVGC